LIPPFHDFPQKRSSGEKPFGEENVHIIQYFFVSGMKKPSYPHTEFSSCHKLDKKDGDEKKIFICYTAWGLGNFL
jgi:hypothetical protein